MSGTTTTTPAERTLPEGLTLVHGGRVERGDGTELCLMEAVALLAGEHHDFRPACTSTVLSSMALEANDRLANPERQKLLPLARELAGTNCPDCEHARARAAAMRAGRISLAGMFQHIGQTMSAHILRSQGSPEGMRRAAQDALRRYVPSPLDDRTHAAEMAIRALRELGDGELAPSAAHSVMTAWYCTLVTGEPQAEAVNALIRETIAACPHGRTRSAQYGTGEREA